jgi:hypothetical protein
MMNNGIKYFLLLSILGIALTQFAFANPIKVEVRKSSSGWELLRDGQPYYIKGAGGHTHLDELVRIGGNSIRTWSTDNAEEILNEAHKRGLTVMMGLWVQHERHGFDYDNKDRVKAQLEAFRKVVLKLKDHPALLMWGVGNEVDLQYTNTNVWYAVNDIAAMIHELDPNHPTCTVTAGLDKAEVALIKERAPHIDIYGINTYGDLPNVPGNIQKFGWEGPYMITEWGPNGHWEVAKTAWGAPIEQSSAEKAVSYSERYIVHIAKNTAFCLGSYVFLWGHKQETTSTWYGLFLEGGEYAEALDELHLHWKGEYPANRAPRLNGASFNGLKELNNIYVNAEEINVVLVDVSDFEGDKLKYNWEIIPESTDIKSGGDAESKPEPIRGLFVARRNNELRFRAPAQEGAYRLFITITDGNEHAAYLNIPFYVVPRPIGSNQSRFVEFIEYDMDSFEIDSTKNNK